ncbi:MAG: SDR family oxidoreductase [Acidobacteriota bacterium]
MGAAADYLVTGGAGFIGSHLVRALLADGAQVRVLDNFLTGKRANLDDVAASPALEIIEGDIRDLATVRDCMKQVRFVLHQAALPSVPRSVSDPATTLSIGVDGTLNVLTGAKAAGCERVVYASSSSVYGNTPTLPKVETMLPAPLSPYAVSKLCGEHLCATFTHLHGLPTVSLRYFNVFGPRQDPRSQYAAVVPRFVTAILAGEPPCIYGDGEQTRDFTYIDNVVQANRLACEAGEGAWGVAMNVACGRRVSVAELARRIGTACGSETISPRHEPSRAGDVRDSLADISRATEVLGFTPAVGLDDGLSRTVEWYRTA